MSADLASSPGTVADDGVELATNRRAYRLAVALAMAITFVVSPLPGVHEAAAVTRVQISITRTGPATWLVTGGTDACLDPAVLQFDYGVGLSTGQTDFGHPTTVSTIKPSPSFQVEITYALPPGDWTLLTASLSCTIGTGPVSATSAVVLTSATPSSNRPPVAANDEYTIPAGGALRIAAPGILANDSDPDGDRITAEFGRHTTLSSSTTHTPGGGLSVVFPAGWNGRACLEYWAVDQYGARSARAFVRITVGTPDPTSQWSFDQCLRLQDDPLAAPAAGARSIGGQNRWNLLWQIRIPYLGQFVTNRYIAYCRQRQGVITYRFGTWTQTLGCWRWGPYQVAY